ncbi:MAG: hypothetical protein K8R54_03935 [Bacteroidales bacterium]|nr:hypothetical protein [Bacteroidales bacterium]
MKITFNKLFRQFLTEYNLPDDFSFSVDLPAEVQNVLAGQILITEYGVRLKSLNMLHETKPDYENQSMFEDNENHFHVASYIKPADNKKSFMLGIKTLNLLAKKFQPERLNGIRFWYSFQTPELGKLWTKQVKLDKEGDEYFISDRLSFYKRRIGEDIISIEENEDKLWAILIIDI